MGSGRIYGTCTANKEKFNFYFDWTSEINIEGNYSTVTVKSYFSPKSGYSYWDFDTVSSRNTSITIDGSTYSYARVINTGNDWSNGNPLLITSYSKKVYHDDDGSKSITISARANGRASDGTTNYGPSSTLDSGSDCVASGSVTLDTIPRAASITAAPNFDDEDNPKISYLNPAGTAVTSLRACISLDGSKADIAYRDISKTGNSYTFNLTTAERNVLRNATKTSNSRKVRFYVETVIGGVTYRDNLEKTLTIINANPTLSPSVADVGSVSTTLTGDSSKMIRYYNSIQVATGAAALKGATITSQSVTCGDKSITTASGRLNNVGTNSFVFKVTDSRGNSTTKTVTMPMVNYVPLTCNVEGDTTLSTADGTKANITFKVKGNYFNGSFGAKSNSLTITYYLQNGSGSRLIEETLTIPSSAFSGSTYSVIYTIPLQVDYQDSYIVYVQAKDAIHNLSTNSKTLKAVPVFDWGEDDFNFNVPVTMNYNGYSYDLLGLFRAMTTTYTLECDVTTGANYTEATAAATLVGTTLRMGITMKRSAAASVGNITNETVMTIYLNHGGKIANLYRVDFNSGTDGGLAAFDVQITNVDDNTAKLTVTLCATTTAADSWNAYFTMPCTIRTKAYV